MVLLYKFKYISKDYTLIRFLDYIVKQFDFDYKILREKDYVFLYVESQTDILDELSNALSSNLPMSLFYYEIKVEVVHSLPKQESIQIIKDKPIPFCPKCLKEVLDENSSDYYNALRVCEICDGFKDGSFIFNNVKVESNKKLFENIAKLISVDKKIKIKTLSGEFVFSKLNNIDKVDSLLVTDLTKLSKLVVESKTDVVALASIEKPSIDFKINEIYRINNNVKKEYIDIRFVNDLTLFLLSIELKKYDIDFLSIENDKTEFDYFLDVKENRNDRVLIDIPKVKCFENKKLFIESNSYSKNLDMIYDKFEEKNKAHFMTVLAENDLFEKSILNFYISTKDDDGFSFYSDEFDGLVDIVKPFHFPKTIKELFDDISKDEVGEKLVNNYKEKFPNEYEKAISNDISLINKKSFYSYWKIAKIVLGFKNDILENATKCLLDKGPRIDYKLSDEEQVYNREFNYSRLIKSAMSFKLAGVEEETISLGYIESLAHFIANEVDSINSSYNLDGVSLCGDMFSYDIFTKLVEKSITKNFDIYYNKEFVIQK